MNFLDNETVELAESLGLTDTDLIYRNDRFLPAYTLEQVERWLFKNHEEGAIVYSRYVMSRYMLDKLGTEPFTARLEGVKQALNYLKQKGESQ